MNKKNEGCKVEGCSGKHKGHGYCQNHLQKVRRGTLEQYPCSHLCKIEGCFKKRYCNDLCGRHYRQEKRQKMSIYVEKTRSNYERGHILFEHKNIETWSRAIKRYHSDKCMICGWDKTNCDTHHIIPKSQQGKNNLKNAVILCPNCHRLAHKGQIEKEQLQQVVDKHIKVKTEEQNNVCMDN